jgi:hypothetical protein
LKDPDVAGKIIFKRILEKSDGGMHCIILLRTGTGTGGGLFERGKKPSGFME